MDYCTLTVHIGAAIRTSATDGAISLARRLANRPDTRIPANLKDESHEESGWASYYGGGECSNRNDSFELEGGTPDAACVQKWNALTSVAAIVAPQRCDPVRGAFSACYTGTPRFLIFCWTRSGSCGSVSYDNAGLCTS